VIQGIATGVGFLGAGAIMKEKDAHGLGRLGSAALGTVFAWFVLAIVIKAEARIHGGGAAQ
jgi:uncharacterized membrane protein YhiD involved in acid resistance